MHIAEYVSQTRSHPQLVPDCDAWTDHLSAPKCCHRTFPPLHTLYTNTSNLEQICQVPNQCFAPFFQLSFQDSPLSTASICIPNEKKTEFKDSMRLLASGLHCHLAVLKACPTLQIPTPSKQNRTHAMQGEVAE